MDASKQEGKTQGKQQRGRESQEMHQGKRLGKYRRGTAPEPREGKGKGGSDDVEGKHNGKVVKGARDW